MAIPKVLGIETEYGIAGGPDSDLINASSLLVNAFARNGRTQINWDFGDESPDHDAREISLLTSVAPLVETHLANTVLSNGARFYVDHAHPEYSSPECRSPLEGVRYDVAGEEVLRRATQLANARGYEGRPIVVYKNNSDGKGNSYGTHENYLVDRRVEFDDLVQALAPHLLSRQVIVGAGKVGAETEWGVEREPAFQLSQRSEFFEELVGLETTLKRPIVNSRDEPHGDPERFRRLHVIIGDANMSQTATLVKLGSTALLLAALEDLGRTAFPAMPQWPVRAVRDFSLDLSLRHGVECQDGVTRSAWDFQDQLWNLADAYVRRGGGEAVASESELNLIMGEWREMLDDVRDDRDRAATRIDWVAKLRLVEGMRDRYDLDEDDARLKAIDLQYHDVRLEKSLAARCGLVELFSATETDAAVTEPPRDTRAYFRGRCVEKFPGQLLAANWDALIFDLGVDPLRRVPMMDPLKGTADLTGQILENCETAEELLRALGAY